MKEIKTYGSIPKTLLEACVRKTLAIREVGNEGGDGYWIYLHDGWWNPEGAIDVIHEYTVKDCIRQLKGVREYTEREKNHYGL